MPDRIIRVKRCDKCKHYVSFQDHWFCYKRKGNKPKWIRICSDDSIPKWCPLEKGTK